MRSLLATLAVLAALLSLVGCKSEPTPADSLKDDAPPAATAPTAGASGGGAAAPGQLPAGVQTKDVPGMGAPPPAGSAEANQAPGGAPAGGRITQ